MLSAKLHVVNVNSMKILYTGGDGKYAKELKTVETDLNISFPSRQECDLLSHENLKTFATSNKYYDIIITGANQFPNNIDSFNVNSFTIPVNHLYLLEKLNRPPKWFINLTTGLNNFDKHFLYRAQKTFCEDLYTRYFKHKNIETHFINFHPHHVDDGYIRTRSAKAFIGMLENIKKYKSGDYIVDFENIKIQKGKI